MDNYIVLSSARTASSYFTGALAKQIGCIEPNVFYGGEFFRWDEYFQLGPPASVSPGSLAMLAKNPALLENYEKSPPSGIAMHVFMSEGGRLQRISRETSWEEHAPVSFRRAWEESQRRLTLLESSYFPWVIKVFPEHFECLDLYRFIGLLRRENTKVVVLYRSFLWDWFLSWAAVRQTGIWQQIRTDGEWEKPQLAPQELSLEFVGTWYKFASAFVNMLLSYRRDADHVIPYEHLTGNPQRDTYRITGIDLFPEVSHQVKLWSTEEKERMIANLDDVKDLFRAYCKLLGYPGGKMVF